MESRSSHFLVGLFVILGSALLATMGVWFAKADIDRTFERYDVVFTGSINGLQEGASVKLRGVPVGRVQEISIDENNIEEIIATIEVDAGTPIKVDSRAVLAMQGVTGLATIELEGGSQSSADLEPEGDQERARIITNRSAIEKVFESTPQLLANGAALLARLEVLLSDDNLDSVSSILRELDGMAGTINDSDKGLGQLIVNVTAATDAIGIAATQAQLQLATLDAVIADASLEGERLSEAANEALVNGSAAAKALEDLAGGLDTTFSNLERPLDDFAQSGLYDFTEMVRELRQLVASLTRISKEFERDPAGFLIGGNQRGFTPQ